MTNTDLGIYGAKRQTWQGKSARALLKKTRDRHTDASVEELEELMHSKVQDDDDVLSEVLTFWITRNLHSLEPSKPATPRERKQLEQRSEEVRAEAKARIDMLVNTLVLSTIMPNGERLADCTGAYLVKLGGSVAKIGKKVGKRKVRDVLTDKDLKELSK